ncbi:hypothetical protein D3C71_249710 [compost metagenome]
MQICDRSRLVGQGDGEFSGLVLRGRLSGDLAVSVDEAVRKRALEAVGDVSDCVLDGRREDGVAAARNLEQDVVGLLVAGLSAALEGCGHRLEDREIEVARQRAARVIDQREREDVDARLGDRADKLAADDGNAVRQALEAVHNRSECIGRDRQVECELLVLHPRRRHVGRAILRIERREVLRLDYLDGEHGAETRVSFAIGRLNLKAPKLSGKFRGIATDDTVFIEIETSRKVACDELVGHAVISVLRCRSYNCVVNEAFDLHGRGCNLYRGTVLHFDLEVIGHRALAAFIGDGDREVNRGAHRLRRAYNGARSRIDVQSRRQRAGSELELTGADHARHCRRYGCRSAAIDGYFRLIGKRQEIVNRDRLHEGLLAAVSVGEVEGNGIIASGLGSAGNDDGVQVYRQRVIEVEARSQIKRERRLDPGSHRWRLGDDGPSNARLDGLEGYTDFLGIDREGEGGRLAAAAVRCHGADDDAGLRLNAGRNAGDFSSFGIKREAVRKLPCENLPVDVAGQILARDLQGIGLIYRPRLVAHLRHVHVGRRGRQLEDVGGSDNAVDVRHFDPEAHRGVEGRNVRRKTAGLDVESCVLRLAVERDETVLHLTDLVLNGRRDNEVLAGMAHLVGDVLDDRSVLNDQVAIGEGDFLVHVVVADEANARRVFLGRGAGEIAALGVEVVRQVADALPLRDRNGRRYLAVHVLVGMAVEGEVRRLACRIVEARGDRGARDQAAADVVPDQHRLLLGGLAARGSRHDARRRIEAEAILNGAALEPPLHDVLGLDRDQLGERDADGSGKEDRDVVADAELRINRVFRIGAGRPRRGLLVAEEEAVSRCGNCRCRDHGGGDDGR